jgi:hypothetical protein
MVYKIAAIALLGLMIGCSSKRVVVKDCQKLEGTDTMNCQFVKNLE